MNDFKKYKYKNKFSKGNKIARFIWNFVWYFFFKPTPRWAFNSWRIFLLKLFGAKIGKGSIVLPTCTIWAPWNLTLGEYSVLGDYVDCYCMDKITIGSKVAISQRTFLCTGTHDISLLTRPLVTKPIVINDHVWVCAEAFISPGITVHKYAVVAARSSVITNVEEKTIVAGNPAKFIKYRSLQEV
jgi:putative colanic acid biosynthesis acetyltransferase WcaF